MSLRYLLDTNTVSYFIRRSSSPLEKRMTLALKQNCAAISTLTRAELRYGQALMDAQDKRRSMIDLLLQQLPHLPWTLEAADQYGQIKSQLKRAGEPIGEIDTQIAAHALAESLILVTHNTQHFERVQGLRVDDWF
ncbi:MAG: type II toxin-antitoxin system VapC family toxin [Brachymonas sp.]|nr:type II toxin-antitoxin system VapC family toxin [Brachymonas sp.]